MTQPGITNPTSSRDQHLTIHQQNVNRLLIAQSNFLHQLDLDVYHFAAIQELYLDSNHNSHATHHWYMVYPKEHYITLSRMRSIILVNRQLASDSWSQVDISSSDMTMLVINTGKWRVLLTNLYNDIGQQQGLTCSICAFWERLHAGESEGWAAQAIWLSNFNLHHPLWDEEHNGHLFLRDNLEKSGTYRCTFWIQFADGTAQGHANAAGTSYWQPHKTGQHIYLLTVSRQHNKVHHAAR